MVFSIKNFFKSILKKLVLIDDSPHKIAGGLALGVFLGILPGAGPMASLVLAFLLHLNKAAAFLGSVLTNTWFSVATFVVAVKLGSWATGTDWHETYRQCKELMGNFHWQDLGDISVLGILKPVFVGYAVVGAMSGIVVYIGALIVLWGYRRRKRKAVGAS